jgi:hypothetical protein
MHSGRKHDFTILQKALEGFAETEEVRKRHFCPPFLAVYI